jgi:hypothetical protein
MVKAILMLLLASLPAVAADAKKEIPPLLNEFLSKAGDPVMHERFWADDLIYVGNAGGKKSKQEILESVRADAKEPQPAGKETYSAEDVSVRQYGDAAALNFKLVRHAGATTEEYRNSGFFVHRNGKWQAVSWQATKVAPPPPPAAK